MLATDVEHALAANIDMQKLHRDPAIGELVLRRPHGAHAAFAELAVEHVALADLVPPRYALGRRGRAQKSSRSRNCARARSSDPSLSVNDGEAS